MPRISFSNVERIGLGFRDGRVRITESTSQVYQYPPNKTTHEQSDAFTAIVWKGVKLNRDDGTEIIDPQTGEPEEIEPIVIRMGDLKDLHPAMLDEKDFDNTEVTPTDLGDEVGTAGNS